MLLDDMLKETMGGLAFDVVRKKAYKNVGFNWLLFTEEKVLSMV